MASTYRCLIAAVPLVLAVISCGFLLIGGGIRGVEMLLIFAICICAYVSVWPHLESRRPESLMIIAAVAIFSIAYIAQAILYLTISAAGATTMVEAIRVRSVFSLAALDAAPHQILLSLQVILAGFAGILVTSVLFKWWSRGSALPAELQTGSVVVSNPVTLGYAAFLCTCFFGLLRKYFGLESPTPSGLPFGVGGLINIASAYVGPNLAFAALFFAMHQRHLEKAKFLALLSVILGLFNYALFTSKLSLVLPVLFLLVCQYLLNFRVVAWRTLLLLGGSFAIIYPFLNLYRSAIALGISPGDLFSTIADMYLSQREASDFEHGILEMGMSAILGRFVGYDPLMILLQAKPYPGSTLEYILYGNLDKFLTYEILNFQDPMGYSPGFLGRLYYISRSHGFVWLMSVMTISILGFLMRRCWRGDIRIRFVTPLLLAYCLIFFTDGIRLELFRSLVLSTVLIYAFLRVFGRTRRLNQ